MNNDLFYLLKSYDEKLLEPDFRKSVQELSEILADNFMEIGASGKTYDKKETVETLISEESKQNFLIEYNIIELSSDIVLSVYKVIQPDINGKTKEHSIRSSLWKYSSDKWQMVFHQGTPLR